MSRLLRCLILVGITWDFVLVLYLIGLVPPLRPIFELSPLPRPSSPHLYVYESLYFHALALPLLAVLTYVVLLKFQVKQTLQSVIITNITAGFLLTSIGGILAMVSWNLLNHALFYAGLVLSFVAGITLLLGVWPRRVSSDASALTLGGFDLPNLILWLSVLAILTSTLVGSYAATGSEAWGAIGSMPQFRLIRSTHEHTVITFVDAVIVLVIAEHYRVRLFAGARSVLVKLGYYGLVAGVPLVAVTTFAAIPYGVEAHLAITPSASLLLQAALFFMYAILADLMIKKQSGNILRRLFGDPLTFGLLFILFWVNIAVTLPGIYVAVNLTAFRGLPNEVPFILGHEHALITLTAIALLLLSVEIFRIQGWPRKLIGLTTTVGYVLSTGAVIPYMFLDPDPYAGSYMPYIEAGLVLTILGAVIAVAAMTATASKQKT